MSKTLEAVVDGEVLRPLEKHGLPDQQRVLVTIVSLNGESGQGTCFELAHSLGLIGIADETPSELSSNPTYLEGFGSR